MPLIPSSDLTPASWIVDSDEPWDRLVTLGPAGFPAYARLRFLPDPAYAGQSENDVERGAGVLPESEQLRAVLESLSRYTSTPDRCWFCLWDGWADLEGSDGAVLVDRVTGATRRGPRIAPAFARSVLDGPKVTVPNRAFYLFQGRLRDLGDWGAAPMWPGRPRPGMPDPAFVWPADRRWCVTRDVDPHWAGIAADTAAIADLVADPRLDVVVVDRDEDVPAYR